MKTGEGAYPVLLACNISINWGKRNTSGNISARLWDR